MTKISSQLIILIGGISLVIFLSIIGQLVYEKIPNSLFIYICIVSGLTTIFWIFTIEIEKDINRKDKQTAKRLSKD